MPAEVSSTVDTVVCSNAAALIADAAYRFTAIAAAATRSGRQFSVALSGGRTPAALYRVLAAQPFKSAIDWTATHLFFGDERCVPPESPFSNFAMAKQALIDPIGLPPANVHRIRAEQVDPANAAEEYALELGRFFGDASAPRFDLILLGMGPDGHTASLFPRRPALEENHKWVVSTEPGLEPYVPRITLTLPVLNSAANVLFLVTGEDKASTVARVLTGAPAPADLPSQSVHPVDGTLTWLVDRAAAAGIAADADAVRP